MRKRPPNSFRTKLKEREAEVPVPPGCRAGWWGATACDAQGAFCHLFLHTVRSEGGALAGRRSSHAETDDSRNRIEARQADSRSPPGIPSEARATCGQDSGRDRQAQISASGDSDSRRFLGSAGMPGVGDCGRAVPKAGHEILPVASAGKRVRTEFRVSGSYRRTRLVAGAAPGRVAGVAKPAERAERFRLVEAPKSRIRRHRFRAAIRAKRGRDAGLRERRRSVRDPGTPHSDRVAPPGGGFGLQDGARGGDASADARPPAGAVGRSSGPCGAFLGNRDRNSDGTLMRRRSCKSGRVRDRCVVPQGVRQYGRSRWLSWRPG